MAGVVRRTLQGQVGVAGTLKDPGNLHTWLDWIFATLYRKGSSV